MAARNLTLSEPGHTTSLHDVTVGESQMFSTYVNCLRGLDEHDPDNWASTVNLARKAGLGKETLCRELSCAWSTILRWEAGQTVPGELARGAIKAKLLDLLEREVKRRKIAV